jgi:hypothetical protein
MQRQVPLGVVPGLAAMGIRNTGSAKVTLAANPEGLAAVYEAGGREYVVFCAAGRRSESAPAEGFAWKAGKAAAQGYYAFALPKKSGK